jgi:hypothetical protein
MTRALGDFAYKRQPHRGVEDQMVGREGGREEGAEGGAEAVRGAASSSMRADPFDPSLSL